METRSLYFVDFSSDVFVSRLAHWIGGLMRLSTPCSIVCLIVIEIIPRIYA